MMRGILLGMAALAVAACSAPAEGPPVEAPLCSDLDPTLAASSFILVRAPGAGERATSPMRIAGCSRTHESNVVWELRGRDGRVLDSGFTTGGGVDGPAPFETAAGFSVTAAQAGELRVYMPDESGGEGFPPPRAIFQVVLAPGA